MEPVSQTCYRHSDRETAVSCSSCGRPICTDCMSPSPVGMRCPECAGKRPGVAGRVAPAVSGPWITYALIALNVAAFLAEMGQGGGTSLSAGGSLINDGGINGPHVASGEWYRLVTGGFLHAGALHIAFNMFALYVLGTMLEPAIGSLRFLGIYMAGLLGGSLGAVLMSPNETTVGASGAIFGLFAATFLIARRRGLEGVASQIGFWLLINLVLTLSVPGISVGGHLGGLAAGAIAGLIVILGERRRHGPGAAAFELLALVALAGGAFVAAVMVA
ncbi:MAG: hypothetical protein QOG09_1806 [Solirubrobacterales bacterium]|nr:hypothetical protein [Solirubrobacterales bacterium]MDX6663704.1 hypothetical protein [Solirubrobacterales bacterium]